MGQQQPRPGPGVVAPASTATASSTAAPSPGTARAPGGTGDCKLPRPGIDFTVFPPRTEAMQSLSAEMPVDFWQRLTVYDLLSEGVKAEGKAFHCGYCEEDVADVPAHLDPNTRKGKLHIRNREICESALKGMREEGWQLQMEGISIRDQKYYCKACSKHDMWYQVFENHLNTNNHARSLWTVDLAKAPQNGGEAERTWKAYVESWDSILVEQGLRPTGDDALRPALPAAAAAAASWAAPPKQCQAPPPGPPPGPPPPSGPAPARRESFQPSPSVPGKAKVSITRALTKVLESEAKNKPPEVEKKSVGDVFELPLDKVYFTHNHISRKFSDGRAFEDLIRDLQSGKVHPKRDNFLVLDVAYVEGERKAFSFNNRRLKCLKEYQQLARKASADARVVVDVCVKGIFETSATALKFASACTTTNRGNWVHVGAAPPRREAAFPRPTFVRHPGTGEPILATGRGQGGATSSAEGRPAFTVFVPSTSNWQNRPAGPSPAPSQQWRGTKPWAPCSGSKPRW